jgi:hypothetical protein
VLAGGHGSSRLILLANSGPRRISRRAGKMGHQEGWEFAAFDARSEFASSIEIAGEPKSL